MLLDKYLPSYTYREYHDIKLCCSAQEAYAAAKNLDFSKSKIIKLLFAMRGLPTSDMTLLGFCQNVKFTLIEELPHDEFIIGFWANLKVEEITDPEAFASDYTSRRFKAVWNFKVEQTGDGLILVSTETRVLCIAMITKIFFSVYWTIIRPFSGLIRKIMLGIIKETVEQRKSS